MMKRISDVSVGGTSSVSSLISVWEGKDDEGEKKVSSLLSFWDDDKEDDEEEETCLFASSINKKDKFKKKKIKKQKKKKKSKRRGHNDDDDDDDNNHRRIPVREVTRHDSKIIILRNLIEKREANTKSKSGRRQRQYDRNHRFERSFSSIPDEIETSSNNSCDEDNNDTELSYPTFTRPSMQYLPQNSILSDSSLSSYASLKPKRSMTQKRSSIGTESTATMIDISERSNSTTSTSNSVVSILRNSSSNRIIRKTSDMISDDASRSTLTKVLWHPQLEFDCEDEEDYHSFTYDNNDDLVSYDERMDFWEDNDDDSVVGHNRSHGNAEKNTIAANIAVGIVSDNDSNDDSDEAFRDPAAYLRRFKANLL